MYQWKDGWKGVYIPLRPRERSQTPSSVGLPGWGQNDRVHLFHFDNLERRRVTKRKSAYIYVAIYLLFANDEPAQGASILSSFLVHPALRETCSPLLLSWCFLREGEALEGRWFACFHGCRTRFLFTFVWYLVSRSTQRIVDPNTGRTKITDWPRPHCLRSFSTQHVPLVSEDISQSLVHVSHIDGCFMNGFEGVTSVLLVTCLH